MQVSLEHFGRDQQPASMASLFKTSSSLLSEMIPAAAQHQRGQCRRVSQDGST